MVLRILIGGAIGLLAGAGIGYLLKSQGGTCPLTCNPYGAAIIGALFGGLIASSFRATGGAEALSGVPAAASAEEFDKVLSGAERPVLADFYTPQCGFCVKLAPRIAKLATEYSSKVAFVKVDLSKVPDLAQRYGIRGVPVVILFSGGREVQRFIGLKDEQEYRRALDALEDPQKKDMP